MKNWIKKSSGDAGVPIMGLFLTLMASVVFFFCLQIQQINILYEEMDEALALSVLSAAVINREDAYSAQQTVFHELDKFEGDITSHEALQKLGNTDDRYLNDSYNYFLQTFTDNFRLDQNLIPLNPLVNSGIRIVEFTVYNVWHELDEDGIRTGNFRICRHIYDPEAQIWNTYWFRENETVMVADSLTKTNIPVEDSMISAQICMTVTKLPYIAGMFEDNEKLTQEVYYIRNADIKEHDILIKDREDSANTNQVMPPAGH